ncbi:MAG: DUF4340 domain-containing protein [Clostridia bacterium]
MIKNKKLLIILSVLLIILIASTVVLVLVVKPSKDNSQSSSAIDDKINIVNSTKENISSISIKNNKGNFTLIQTEANVYKLKDSENAQLDTNTAKAIFDVLSIIDAKKDIGVNENLNEFGLEPAIASADISYNDGTTINLKLGKTLSDGKYYFKTSNSKNIYAVDSSIGVNLLIDKMSLFSTTLLKSNITADTLKSFSILEGTTPKITVVKNQAPPSSTNYFSLTTQFQITEPFNWNADDNVILGSSNQDNGIVFFLSQIRLKEVVADNVNKETLDKYNLSAPAYTIKIYDNDKSVIFLSKKQTDNTYYAYSDTSSVVGKIDASILPFIEKNINYFCNKLTSVIDIKLVNALTISSSDKSYKFDLVDSDKSGDEMKVMYNGKQMDTADFRQLYTISLSANITGLGKKTTNVPYLTVEISLKDGNKNVIKYYNIDNSLECFAEINGSDKFMVFKSSVDKIINSASDFIEGKKIKADD